MKKLMIAACAVAMACAAEAEGLSVNTYVSNYGLIDTNPSWKNCGWYKFYGLTQNAAKTAMGASAPSGTVTANDYSAWLINNFSDNKAATVANALTTVAPNSYKPDDGGYAYQNYEDTIYPNDRLIGVVVFDNSDGEVAYNVVVLDSEKWAFQVWPPEGGYTSSGWQTVTSSVVPEPTSGLLLLLGMAGLALKRKRA